MDVVDSPAVQTSRRDLRGPRVLYLVLFVLLGLLCLGPLVVVILYSVTRSHGIILGEGGFSLEHFARVITQTKVYGNILVRSIGLGLAAAAITLVVSYLPAWFIASQRGTWQRLLLLLIVVPFWTPYVIRIFAWMQILSENGFINWTLALFGVDGGNGILYTNGAVLIGLVYSGIPFVVLPIYASISGIDPALYEAARNLGARESARFWHITVPLSLPGVLSGTILSFILAAGSYLAPVILGGPNNTMVSQLVYSRFLTSLDWPVGAAVAVTYLALVGVVVAVIWRLTTLAAAFRMNTTDNGR